MDQNLFRSVLAKAGYTQAMLAKELNMAESTMTRKIKHNSFTISEAEMIGEILGIATSELGCIFFKRKVTC